MVAKIRVNWPDGAICGACFSQAANSYGTCAHCHEHRLLPGRSPSGEVLCRDCARITTNLTCAHCGKEGERLRAGHCATCIIIADLTALLHPSDPPDLRLHRLIRELATATRPRSVITWMRLPAPRTLLDRIGDRTLVLSHAGFDAEPHSPAREYLRDLLEHHHILPIRGDRQLVRFESWLDKRMQSFVDMPHIAQPLEQFARWHHLKRLRGHTRSGNMDYATRTAKQEITEAGKFLIWLHEEQHTTLTQLRQEHIDIYWSEGTTTRKHVRNLLQYHRITGLKNRLKAPARQGQATPMTSERERLDAIKRVVNNNHVFAGTRIAALIFLLYGTPIGKIVALKIDRIISNEQGMTITLGEQPAPIPEPLIAMFTGYLHTHAGTRAMNKNSPWLFPSTRAGTHITANALWARLKIFEIQPLATKNTTLFDLTKEIDPATLAALLGYAPKTMANHANRAGNTMTSYPASRIAPITPTASKNDQ